MADVLPAVEASPVHLSTSPTATGPAAASTATGLGLTSVAMENGVSSGSGSSRSSGGETVAGAAGMPRAGEEEEEDEEQRRERERDRTDSLAKLEGRAPTTPKMVQAPSTPVSPRVAGSPRGGRRSAESLRGAVPRPRLHSSPRLSGASSRASLATFDSLLTTGESVYEDATEGDTDDGWEDEPNLPRSLPNLTKSPLLPDTPPSEEELASASSDVRKTPRASSPHTPPQASHPEFVDGQHLPPSSSSFEEQAILLQRRATLQAEASRRIAIRQSISHSNSPTTPTDSSSTVLSLRRFSTTPRQSAHPTDPHRASLSSTSSSPLANSPTRQWHPKPLVLTPARTIHTPLTSSAASPSRRRESAGLTSSSSGHSRTQSTLSNLSNWSGGGGANRPVSFRSASPYKAITLGRTGSLAGPSSSSSSSFASRRRSTGYVESAGDLALPRDRYHRKSLSATSIGSGAGRISWMTPGASQAGVGGEMPLRRDRSASEDTGASHLTETGESTTSTVETRYASSEREGEGERGTPDSSASGWSDEKETSGAVEGEKVEGKKGSPSLDDKEWEREYFRRTGSASASGTPLESVQEGESATGSDTPATTLQARFSPRPSQLEEGQAETDTEAKERVEEATSGALAETSRAPITAQVGEEEEKSPELAPPIPYLSTDTSASPPVPPKEPGLTSPRQPQLGSPRQSAPTSPRNSTVAPVSPTTPNRRRPSARYDELWNGEPSFDSAASDSEVSLSLSTPPRNTSFEASASRPTSQLNPAHSGETNPASPARSIASSTDATKSNAPRKGKPIVIKSVTARSSAANARRSQRLSQVEPPLLDGTSGTPNRLSSRFEGGPAHNRLSARLGENGAASQRLSTRLSKRLSIAPSSPKQPSSPPTATTSPTATSTGTRSPPSATRSPPQLRKSPPQDETPQLGNVVATGLAIWPPPAETKTVTLAPPLAYHTDSELSSASIGEATDDEDIPPTSPHRAAERERARIGHSTSPRSSGYSFPNSTRRRTPFEPRDPRAKRDDFDTGDSFLEVLLSTEPPPSMNFNRRHYLDEDDRSYASNSTGTTLQGPFQAKQGGGITKKLFGGLKNKSPTGSSSDDRVKKPISIAPSGSSHRRRSGPNKPRPVVSAPLELQAASHAMLAGQRSFSGSSQGSQGSQQYWGSVQGSPNQPQSSIALGAALASRYTSAAAAATGTGGNDDAAEELASMYGDGSDGRPSMDSVYRPPPKAYALPPGLLSAGDAPPLPPHRPTRPSASPSLSQTSQRSSVGLAPSPAQSFTSVLNSPFQMRPRQGSKDSSAAGSFISSSAGSATSPFYPRKGSTGSATQTGTGFDLAALPVMSTREVLREQVVQR